MKNLDNFTETQEKLIEQTFDKYRIDLKKASSFIKLTNESLINVHGEYNPNIEPDEIDDILKTIQELLEPLNSFLCELSVNGNFLLCERNLQYINFNQKEI